MYISPILAGIFIGVVVTITVLIIATIFYNKKGNGHDE